VNILCEVEIPFGVEFGLRIPLPIKCGLIFGLHKSLIGYPNPFTSIVAGGAGFNWNSRVVYIVN